MDYGFVKVAATVPHVRVADCAHNVERIAAMVYRAEAEGVQALVFPELCVTAYTCMDLFAQETLLHRAEEALLHLAETTKDTDLFFVVGAPLRTEGGLANAAVAFRHGHILGVVPKSFLPSAGEFQESRWFTPSAELQGRRTRIGRRSYPLGRDLLFAVGRSIIGIELCEDLWAPSPPSARLAMRGANIILNLSASNELIGKEAYRRQLVAQQSARCLAGYVYTSCGTGESSTDMVFAGHALIAENGVILKESERFSTDEQFIACQIDIENLQHDRLTSSTFFKAESGAPAGNVLPPHRIDTKVREVSAQRPFHLERTVSPHPFIPAEGAEERWEDIVRMQVSGLAQRLRHTGVATAVVGVSGGLDSTLALLVTVQAFDLLHRPRTQVTGVTLPGPGTSERTHANAVKLIRSLGAGLKEIDIRQACLVHFHDIGHDPNNHDTTFENVQARERTQILMDIANVANGLVVGTGDLSELALGWATYNGDHMSMYAVNVGIPKTLVRHLVHWVATHRTDEATRQTLLDIIDTPISPELLPTSAEGVIAQRTEDLVGPYELHDFFLYHFLRFGARPSKIFLLAQKAFDGVYDAETIRRWMAVFFRRFFHQQFKRSCLPDGPKVGSISLSPRSDWRMPSDASADEWLAEVEQLKSS
ncbi:MAG: NAD(+) synthase [Tannerellaceae bacterium]|jgi:NAD+ synthase (glutamine-hydrolysing)|nr:NAD(+) synthase [Tannerellaceae bacterium]